MRPSLLLVLPLAVAMLAGAHAQGQGAAFLAEAKAGDSDLNAPLKTFQGKVGYLDANGNSRPDVAAPDEAIYLDLDSSGTVNYGDVRLSAFGAHGAGTGVDMVDADFGRILVFPSSSWFARTEEGTWHYDMDGSRTVTVGDARFAGELPTKVRGGDPRLGATLTQPEGSQGAVFGTLQSQGERGLTTSFYVDLDAFSTGGGRVTPGDLRLAPRAPSAPATTSTPTSTRTVTATGGGAFTETQEVTVGGATATSGWRPLDGLLVGLGVVNLAGLVVVWRLLKDTRPRNPFQ